MRVFVTGASGFVGSAIVKELLQAGHQVLGLARSDKAADAITKVGAEVHRGDVNDLDNLKKAAASCDAVIHTAFNHEFVNFKQDCENDRKVITALGNALKGTKRPLVVTSGVGLMSMDRLITEEDKPASSDVTPRAATEEATNAVREAGVNSYILRLPPTTHGAGDHGFIHMVINMDKEKGAAAYVGEGQNCWPAAHRFDAATLYRLIIEKQPEQKVFHAVAEEGVPFRQITETIGKGLGLPVVSKTGKEVEEHFGWFHHFASINCAASSEQTRKTLGWAPQHQTLMEDLESGVYFQ